jgi:hypothetical protein
MKMIRENRGSATNRGKSHIGGIRDQISHIVHILSYALLPLFILLFLDDLWAESKKMLRRIDLKRFIHSCSILINMRLSFHDYEIFTITHSVHSIPMLAQCRGKFIFVWSSVPRRSVAVWNLQTSVVHTVYV